MAGAEEIDALRELSSALREHSQALADHSAALREHALEMRLERDPDEQEVMDDD